MENIKSALLVLTFADWGGLISLLPLLLCALCLALLPQRVTLADFHRGTKNCSYFAVAPLEIAQSKLIGLLTSLRERALQEAAEASGADPSAAAGLVEKPWQQQQASSPAGAAEAGGGGDGGGGEVVKEVKEEAAVMAS